MGNFFYGKGLIRIMWISLSVWRERVSNGTARQTLEVKSVQESATVRRAFVGIGAFSEWN